MRKILLAGLLAPIVVNAQTAPSVVKTITGQYAGLRPAVAVCSVASDGTPQQCANGAPAPTTYKTVTGQMAAMSYVAPVCSVDSNGAPQLCPAGGGSGGGMTQAQADARYLQLSGGTLTGALTVNGNLSTEANAYFGQGKSFYMYDPNGNDTWTFYSTGYMQTGTDNSATYKGWEFKSVLMQGVLVQASSTFANLPTGQTAGASIYCSDCYSTLRVSGNMATGLATTFNGTNWVDGNGNPVLH